MRGADTETSGLFSYVSCESRVPADHPLRIIRAIVDEAWASSRRRSTGYMCGFRRSQP
jgi:hypothetical protein